MGAEAGEGAGAEEQKLYDMATEAAFDLWLTAFKRRYEAAHLAGT